MWEDLLRAFALVMVLEGLFPFLLPEKWREMVMSVASVPPNKLRLFGGVLIGSGLILLNLLRP